MYDCASGGVPLSSDASKPHDDAYRQPRRSSELATAHQEHAQALDLNMNSGYSLYSQVGRRGSAVSGGREGGSLRADTRLALRLSRAANTDVASSVGRCCLAHPTALCRLCGYRSAGGRVVISMSNKKQTIRREEQSFSVQLRYPRPSPCVMQRGPEMPAAGMS